MGGGLGVASVDFTTLSGVRTSSGSSGSELLRRVAVRQRRERMLVVGVAALAIIGGLNAIFGFLFGGSPPVEPEAAALRLESHSALASSFAEDFVVTYLSAGSGSAPTLARYVAAQVSLPTVGRDVSEPLVAYLERVRVTGGLEIWSVTVAVRVGDDGGPRQYYRVGVSLLQGQLRALSLPEQVAQPGRGVDLSTVYRSSCGSSDQLYSVTSGFLGAMLAGTADITRYTTADAGIAALSPAPYNSLDTDSVTADDSSCGAKGSVAHVLITVTPHGAAGPTPPLSYPLTLTRANGQWQVAAMDAVPALGDRLAVVNESDSTARTTVTTTAAATDAAVPPATHN